MIFFSLQAKILLAVITQVEVTEMEENKKMEIEVMRKKIVDATNDASLIIMGLNKELSDLEVNSTISLYAQAREPTENCRRQLKRRLVPAEF